MLFDLDAGRVASADRYGAETCPTILRTGDGPSHQGDQAASQCRRGQDPDASREGLGLSHVSERGGHQPYGQHDHQAYEEHRQQTPRNAGEWIEEVSPLLADPDARALSNDLSVHQSPSAPHARPGYASSARYSWIVLVPLPSSSCTSMRTSRSAIDWTSSLTCSVPSARRSVTVYFTVRRVGSPTSLSTSVTLIVRPTTPSSTSHCTMDRQPAHDGVNTRTVTR